MKKKKFLKQVGAFVLDFFEIFTPAIAFSLLFGIPLTVSLRVNLAAYEFPMFLTLGVDGYEG